MEAEGSAHPGLRGAEQQAWNRGDYLDDSKTPPDISPALKCCVKVHGFMEIKWTLSAALVYLQNWTSFTGLSEIAETNIL